MVNQSEWQDVADRGFAGSAVGQLNRWLGWTLLVLGFGVGAWLDPWSLGERDPARLLETHRLTARHAQAVVVAMGFLQLAVAHILQSARLRSGLDRLASWATGVGALLYSVGYISGIAWPPLYWAVPLGAGMNLCGFGLLARPRSADELPLVTRLLLVMFSFGMLMDMGMGLFAAAPERFLPEYLGGLEGVRMRMLRLARAAVIALSTLTLLYQERRVAELSPPRVARWGGYLLLVGAIAMPLVLTLSAAVFLPFKYLLSIPAQCVVAGTIIAAWMSHRRAVLLESFGWWLILAGMSGGLLMGLYAFEGPLPAPSSLADYNGYARRLTRLLHGYWIVQGLLAIFLSRHLEHSEVVDSTLRRIGCVMVILAVGVDTTALLLVASGFSWALSWMGVGAVLLAISIPISLWASGRANGGGAGRSDGQVCESA